MKKPIFVFLLGGAALLTSYYVFDKVEDPAPVVCEICENECPCPDADCACDDDTCKCPKCIA